MSVGSVLTNVVTIAAAKTAAAAYTTTSSVASAPLLNVFVSDNIDPVRVGRSLVYFIPYSNNGNATAHGLRITETYPSGVTFVTANPSPTLTPTLGSHVWLPADLAAGGTRFINVTVLVNSPLPDLTSLTNRITITSNEVPTPTEATESTLVQSPVLTLTLDADPPSPQANGPITYSLNYTNTGSTYASAVVLTATLPNNLVFQSCVPGCDYNPVTRRATWNLAQVDSQAANVATIAATVVNNLPNGTLVTTSAGIVATENVRAYASLTTAVASQPALSLAISNGVTDVAADDLLNYTLTFANLGNSPAQSVVITDRIPNETEFRGCSISCTVVGDGVYSFNLGTVNASASGSVTLSVKVSSPLPAGLRFITNTAGITTTTPGDTGHSASDVDVLTTVPHLAMSVDYDASTPTEGKIITYTVHYTNTSKMDTTGVVISVTPSPFVIQTGGGGTGRPLGDLPAGDSDQWVYSITLPMTFSADMDAFVNGFTISDNGPGGLPIASDAAVTSIGVPDLKIDDVTFSPSTVVAGASFTATVTIRNIGSGAAYNPSFNQGGFYVDLFTDPISPPLSFPFERYGQRGIKLAPVDAGASVTAVFTGVSFLPTQQPILYFKVDNYDCDDFPVACVPSSGLRGLIPESNEYNNVLGPVNVNQRKLYLPLVRKS